MQNGVHRLIKHKFIFLLQIQLKRQLLLALPKKAGRKVRERNEKKSNRILLWEEAGEVG